MYIVIYIIIITNIKLCNLTLFITNEKWNVYKDLFSVDDNNQLLVYNFSH